MNQIDNNQQDGSSINIVAELSNNLTVHKNISQEIIVTTADKIKLVLSDTKEIMLSKREWVSPFVLLFSFVTTLLTADFKEVMNLPKDFWHAVFVILSIGSSIWLFITVRKLIKYWGRDDLDKIIEQIKLNNEKSSKN